ncbi:lipoprotein-releasing ABC transporter permease subunit [Pseudoalteromonas denitrificans]|uniref:Lipoprotein-releasing system permease protein n=1 Tax=Pseudoalteromonas denitrificans DSM 6059 TaxID=1123010 RepID=A0A1I1PEP3_9GAMM|nr:lipoprotein-releasing ABC transporter permease subunit [Pseudoalteromonas denitrificans]SFD06098.1 lipoprotein-releasing system permease protein [Pseudoalteromonas denitrificans DSM 6059]
MKFSLFLSQRFRHAKHENGFIGFIGKASSIGIGLGIAVLIIALSVINGFEYQMVHRLLNVVPHIEYEAPNAPISNWQTKIAKFEEDDAVIAAAPFILLNGMAQFKGKLKAVEIRGIDPKLEVKVSGIQTYIKSFELASLSQNQVVLGQQIVDELGVNLGDQVTLLIPQINEKSSKLKAAKKIKLKLVGIVKMGGPIDRITALVNLSQTQQILGFDSSETKGLRLKVADVFAANSLAMTLGYQLEDYVYVSSWFRKHSNLYQDIQMVRTIVYLVVLLIIAVASFNIVSTLVMEVKEKQSDIAILKTMGAKDSTIISTFMLQGLGQSISGIFFGTFIGVLLAIYIPDMFIWYSELSGKNVLTGIYFVEFLPSRLNLNDVIVTVSMTLVMTIIATAYPAWQASRIDPAKVLGQ